jgi:hypothetical protein
MVVPIFCFWLTGYIHLALKNKAHDENHLMLFHLLPREKRYSMRQFMTRQWTGYAF